MKSGKNLPGEPVILLLLAIASFYIGGWYIVWGANIWPLTDSWILDLDRGFAIRVNDLYYGMLFRPRLFDAPFISDVCLILGCVFGEMAFKQIFLLRQ